MPPVPLILAAAGDPGGAAALAPVLEHLHQAGGVKVKALAYREAVQLWAAASFPWAAFPDALDDPGLESLADSAALLLAGSSGPNGLDYEKRLVAVFRRLGRPSLVLVDYWANYGRRFSTGDGRLAYVPDRIAAIDEASRQGLVAAGIPLERIVITGHPGFDRLGEAALTLHPDRKNELRGELGVAQDERLVVFASHPIAALRSTHEERQAAIECLAGVLARIAAADAMKIALVIRPHPKEAQRPHPHERSHPRVRVYWSGAGESRQAALAADAVAGVETMFLVEAYHMGCPTISIRLGAGERGDPAVGVPAAQDEKSLEAFMGQALRERAGPGTARPPNAPVPGAVLRVAALVSEMLAARA